MTTTIVAISVIVNTEGQILLTQRFDPKNKSIHMRWQIPGGGVEAGETPFQACIREAKEETGLEVEILTQNPFVIEQEYPDESLRLNVFLAKPISGTIDTSLDDETNNVKWCWLDEIKRLSTLDRTYEMASECLSLWKKL